MAKTHMGILECDAFREWHSFIGWTDNRFNNLHFRISLETSNDYMLQTRSDYYFA